MFAFPSLIHSLPLFLLHSLCHPSFGFPSTFNDPSFIASLSLPSVLFSLCSLKFIGVSTLSWMFPHFSFHSSFSPFIHASIRGTCFNSQCSPGSAEPCRGLCALTFERCLHDFFCSIILSAIQKYKQSSPDATSGCCLNILDTIDMFYPVMYSLKPKPFIGNTR